MPEKSIKSVRANKAFNTIAVVAFVLLFIASLMLAMILPFKDVVNVASASFVPSTPTNTRYVMSALNNDYKKPINNIYYDLSVPCTGNSSWWIDFDNTTNGFSFTDSQKIVYSSNTIWYQTLGFVYGYQYTAPFGSIISPNATAPTYKKITLSLCYAYREFNDGRIWKDFGLYDCASTSASLYLPIFSSRVFSLFENGWDGRQVAAYPLHDGSQYMYPTYASNYVPGTLFCPYPLMSNQVATGSSFKWYYTFEGYVTKLSDVPTGYPSQHVFSGSTSNSFALYSLLNQVFSFGYDIQVDDSSDAMYNSGYADGWNDYKDNFSTEIEEEKTKSYNEGKSKGYADGYNVGYSKASNDYLESNYTFGGLLGAVFDVPIQTFRGLFNFEILGVNMASFISSLIALAIVIIFVKISLGR